MTAIEQGEQPSAGGERSVRGAAARLRRATIGRAHGAWRRFTRRRSRDAALARLRSDDDPTIAAVGRALSAAVSPPSPEERAWIERIERLRSALGSSDQVFRSRRAEWTGRPEHQNIRETEVSRLALEVSKPARWGRVLLNLNRELRPVWSLELGTCIGLSTAYQAAGHELSGKRGRVVTVELNAPRVELARDNLGELGLADRVDSRQGRFREALGEVFRDVGQVGFAFVDGHHKEGPTLKYFERISSRIRRPGVILFDDITWSEGMRKAWARISVDPRVSLALDLHGLGLCVVRGADADGGKGVPHVLDVVLHP